MDIIVKMEKAKRLEELLTKLLWENIKKETYDTLVEEIDTFLRSKK